jgi:putative ABC transport system substrate-binding protein
LGGKRLELLKDTLPKLQRVAVLWSQLFPENVSIAGSVRRSGSELGVKVTMQQMRGLEELELAFRDAARAGAEAIVFLTDNTLFGHRRTVAELALAHKLPSIHAFPPEVRDGALLSFGPDIGESYRRAAALTDRVLKGTKPADLPVEGPTRFTLAINLKTAKALGLTIPPMLLARADEVIE